MGIINAAGGIPTYFTDQFPATLYAVCQQKESKLAQAVRVEPVLSAEDKAFDLLDKIEMQAKVGRNVETPNTDPTSQRRWVSTDPYHNAVLFDKDDDLSMLIDPTSDFTTALVRAVNRKKDDIILAAFEADVSSGRRAGSTITWAGQDGNTKYTGKDTGRTIAHDTSTGNCDASQTGMTVEKIQLAKEYFANNDVDDDIPIWCVISPRQATNLFGQEEYVNADYARDKPLATGRILRNWYGINWVVSSKVTVGSSNDVDADTNVYECWCWAEDGMILGVQEDMYTRIAMRYDRSDSQEVYVHMNMGAMRMDEDKVIKIECQA